jgi:tetraacyldisaccharide 4'-kinase
VNPPDALRGRRVVGFAGIGRPSAFRRTLEAGGGGGGLQRLRRPPRLHPGRFERLVLVSAAGAWLVTTEKDAVRCPEGAPVHVVRLGVDVLEGEEHLERLLSV